MMRTAPRTRRILVVDDEANIREALRQVLEFADYEVRTAPSAEKGIAEYESWRPDVVLQDVKMSGMDGIEALRKLRAIDPEAIVIMISGHATVQMAIEATHLGAYDVLEKPLDTDRTLVTIRNALERVVLGEENERLRQRIEARFEIVGRSFAIHAVTDKIEKVAATPARVLITGENGTGKELVARAIHRESTRADGPFVEVNCAAIPSELIESELFGHVKGSFTGAIQDRAGKFEQANGGTLFLDEIGDMSLEAQAKVLRVLEDGRVTRIGGSRAIQVDVRVLSATNKRLPAEIAAGRFREDLYYRLNVVPIEVPPLRDRRDDVPILTAHFVNVLTQQEGVPPKRLTEGAMARLQHYDWPGNVRELRNTIERLLILSPGKEIEAADVDRLIGGRDPDVLGVQRVLEARTLEEFHEAAERAFILHKLRQHDWVVRNAAEAIGMQRSHLYKKIEKYGLSRESH